MVAEGLANRGVMCKEEIYVKVANYWKITDSNGRVALAELHASLPGRLSIYKLRKRMFLARS